MPTDARLKKLQRVARLRQPGLTVVLEDLHDPHNLGAISRSCDAFGLQDIHVVFQREQPFDPKEKGKNSSTATNKWLRYHMHRDAATPLRELKEAGWQLVATAVAPQAEAIFSADFCGQRLALLFGNEKTGLSPQALAMADRLVALPMRGIAQSVNVSVAASIFLYEVTRQRIARCPERLSSTPEQGEETLAYFLEMHESLARRNKGRRKDRANKAET